MQVPFDTESLRRYCLKYGISPQFGAEAVAAFQGQKPKQYPPEYDWQKEGVYGCEAVVRGMKVKIEMANMRHADDTAMNNVSFIGFDGINWNATS